MSECGTDGIGDFLVYSGPGLSAVLANADASDSSELMADQTTTVTTSYILYVTVISFIVTAFYGTEICNADNMYQCFVIESSTILLQIANLVGIFVY